MSEERRTGWEGADRWFASPPSGGGDEPPPAAEETPPPPPRCEVCGAELEHDQTYCLECGSPTPLAPRLRRGRKGMAVLAGAVAVLGLGAGALAYAVAEDDDGGLMAATITTPSAPIIPGTVPLPPETGPTTGPLPPDTSLGTVTLPTTDPTASTGFDTVTAVTVPPTAPATTSEQPTTEQQPTTADDPVTEPSGDSDWPAGRIAWTAILSSVRSESDARAAKARLSSSGQPAGVLLSSDYTDLRPGYWVLFSGTYDDRSAAIAQATQLRPQFPGAYARRIEG